MAVILWLNTRCKELASEFIDLFELWLIKSVRICNGYKINKHGVSMLKTNSLKQNIVSIDNFVILILIKS